MQFTSVWQEAVQGRAVEIICFGVSVVPSVMTE